MKKFILSIDSACDLPKLFLEKIGVHFVRMKHTENDKQIADFMCEAKMSDFYAKMREGVIMRTSQVNPDEYAEYFVNLLKFGLPIIHLTLSSGVSGTFSSCKTAIEIVREDYPDANITAVDTTVGSLAMVGLLFDAVRLRNRGGSYEQCLQLLETKRHCVNTILTTGDLQYLYRGGRLSRLSTAVGTVLKINPIISLNRAGQLYVSGKARGEGPTFSKVAAEVLRSATNPSEQTLFISHADNFDGSRRLAALIQKQCKFKNVFYSYIGETLGSHAGPGLIAVFFYGTERI